MATLDRLLTDFSQKKKTGMLSVMVKVTNQLFKIYITDGEIHHILYGDRRNADCFIDFDKIEFSDCFFFSGAKANTNEKINISTAEIIRRIKAANKSVVCKDMGEHAVPEAFQDFPAVREKLKAALIRQIGPVGGIVFPKALEKWTAAGGASRQTLGDLVNLLAAEIDDSMNKTAFIDEAKKIVS